MKRSQIGNRPYARKRRVLGNMGGSGSRSEFCGLQDLAGPAGRLAGWAGLAARPAVEPLEARQLLFSLIVTEDSVVDGTGVGTVSAEFAYFIPYLLPGQEVDDPQPDEIVPEDFNGEPFAPVLPTNVVNGQTFDGSNLVVFHTINPPSDFRLLPEIQGENDAAYLSARAQNGESFSFRVTDIEGVNTGPYRGVRNFELDILAAAGGNVGLNTDNMRVVLLFGGEVVGSFTGAGLAALNETANPPAPGVGHFNFETADGTFFDTIRFEAIAGDNNEAFLMDNVQFALPDVTSTVAFMESRIFLARFTLSGPVGATARFLDLRGEEMVATLFIGVPENGTVLIGDRNGDGSEEFNSGIGRIILSGTDSSTTILGVGGTIEEGAFVYPQAWAGLYDDFEGAGFGYALTLETPPRIVGLSGGPGSLIIGAPWVRPEQGGNPFGLATGLNNYDFNRADQGIFVNGGADMGHINIHGILNGSSRFSGAVDQISVGALMGSITVAGDLGALIVGSEAGLWAPDAPSQGTDQGIMRSTESQLIVGRTLGEVAIAGRSLLNITVVGDLNDPENNPARDTYRYFEKEFAYPIPAVPNPVAAFYNAHQGSTAGHHIDILVSADGSAPFQNTRDASASAFGLGVYRNDSFLSAEWVGNIGSAVQIYGNMGYSDTAINTAEDQADAFSFAVDGTQPIVITLDQTQGPVFMRLLDASGRTVAAGNYDDVTAALTGQIRYDAVEPGVYTVVLGHPADGGYISGTDYMLTISGMAPTTFGAYRSGSGTGNFAPTNPQNFINVLSGSIGSIRIGTGYWASGGTEADPSEVYNPQEEADAFTLDDAMAWSGGTYSTPGNLYQILTGGDIGGRAVTATISVNVGGNFGVMLTGQSPVLGIAPEQGDLDQFTLNVGGRIAVLDVRGAIGLDQDGDPDVTSFPDAIQIRTGTKTGRGDIGMIRVGSHIFADTLRITATPGAVIGAFLVSQDIAFDPTTDDYGIYGQLTVGKGVPITTGSGADVRFVDFPRIDLENSADAGDSLDGGNIVRFTDDGGATIEIQIIGGTGGGFVRSLAIDDSQGKAIATIDADLSGGGLLQIRSLIGPGGSQGRVSIGKINITGGNTESVVRIEGDVEIDVWQILQTGGDAIGRVINSTTNGDVVVIDAAAIGRINITGGGSLGRTEMVSWGPRLIGPFVGIGGGGGRALTVPAAGFLMDDDFNGALYRPVNSGTHEAGQAFMDDIGGPVSPYINGAVARTGDILEITVAGSIGDVVALQGNIIALTANSDNIAAPGVFEGIVGVIYANDIQAINIGMGLAARTHSPIPTTGIFANDDIFGVTGSQAGAFIASTISAGNINQVDRNGILDGIETITLSGGGDFRDAYISSSELDAFWVGSSPLDRDGHFVNGNLNALTGTGADFFRSEILVRNLPTFTLNGGVYDASRINATDSAGTIQAVAFRNSTLTGTELEFRDNEILIGGNLAVLQTLGSAGDMNDLRVDVLGSVTQQITALNFNRTQLEVDGTITLLDVVSNFRAGIVSTGRLQSMVVAGDLVSSRVSVSGALESLTATNIVNSRIEVTGPDGRIDLITTQGLFSGSVSASGSIDTLESLGGDIIARITTTTDLGNVALIRAARDLDITTDISGNLSQLVAGRHLGNRLKQGVILVRGDLQSASISGDPLLPLPPDQVSYANGQLYADLRIGGALLGEITIGRANTKPGSLELGRGSIVAFGRLNSIVVNGDFAGDIINHSGDIGSIVINNGSFYDGALIAAYNGSLSSLVINAGHLLGDVHADYFISLIQLNADADGVFGDIGINPTLSAAVSADEYRNQLPLGSTESFEVQGPTISAGRQITQITLTNGSIFEAMIFAGHAIGVIDVNGNISNDPATQGVGTVIAAGDLVQTLNVTGSVSDAAILAGIVDFGSDGRAGGTGDAADTVKAGRVQAVNIGGNATNVAIAAGMTAGTDGTYNSAGARHALGLSYVQNVTIAGAVSNVTAFADSGLTSATAGVVIGGRDTPVVGGVLEAVLVTRDGNGVPIWSELGTVLADGVAFDFGGGTITYTGPGVVVWDAANNRLLLLNTTLRTNVTVTSTSGTLADFDIVSNDDAMAGIIDIQASLTGSSSIIVDGFVTQILAGGFSGTGSIMLGNDLQLLQLGSFTGGTVSAIFVRQVSIGGSASGTIRIYGSEGMSIGGDFTGDVRLERGLRGTFVVGGHMRLATLSSGGGIDGVTASSVDRSLISARDSVGFVTIAGDMTDAAVVGGADLGTDGRFGGQGADADSVHNGGVGAVTVGGGFAKSDVIAGALRGADGFFGTADDVIADGRSTVGAVTIAGNTVGSNLGSESYRVFATGTIGTVTVGGQVVTERGNFLVDRGDTQPQAIQVLDLAVTQDSGVYTAQIFFNQAMDASTIGPALGVFEVRGESGEVTIRLIEGLDYTLSYDAATASASIVFATAVTRRNLPQQPGLPGLGIYRFQLDADVLRAAVAGARLDGDGDGFPRGEDYVANDIVGDAGDKLESEQIVLTNPDNGEVTDVDVYGAVNLNIVLDNPFTPDGVADANRVFTLRGSIGDHPDNDTNNFRFGSDVDVYTVTLQAGQILRIGASVGTVGLNSLFNSGNSVLYDAAGIAVGNPGSAALVLPSAGEADGLATTFGQTFLVNQTGRYVLVISGPAAANAFYDQPGVLPNITGQASEVGDYEFTLEIFDDGNSGFAGPTDSGDGEKTPKTPPADNFAGADGVLGTADDLASIVVGKYTFTRDSAGNVVTNIASAIGPEGFAGVPGQITPDVDVYHLNNGLAVEAGTRMRVTVRLTDLGSDLGSRIDGRNGGGTAFPVRYAGQVQFGIFDTTGSTDVGDGVLLFSPTDFAPSGGTPGTIASNGSTTYGYDDRGDFFVEFVAPGTEVGNDLDPAKYAAYIQGVFNTDYQLEIVTLGNSAVPQPTHQNIFLETRGGVIDWLQASGISTDLSAFDGRMLGFVGSIDGVAVNQYILSRVVSNLNDAFAASALSVTVSANPADFEFEDFSTVFISNQVDPINFFNANIFGYSEHSDPLNADKTDEAVVFVQPMASLGYTPSRADIDQFTESLTAAVGRRVGELLGLRIAGPEADGGSIVDIMGSNSVANTPDDGGVYQFSTFNRPLSVRFDSIGGTDFYLGTQNSVSLLDRLLGQ
jgi:hypothetical protein